VTTTNSTTTAAAAAAAPATVMDGSQAGLEPSIYSKMFSKLRKKESGQEERH
jgi:hypothetical protein